MEVVYTEKPCKSFFYGWLFGLTFMGGVSYWLIVLPGGYIAWGAYCIFYGLYPAVLCFIISFLKLKLPYYIIIITPFLWVSMEWIRSLGFMGFTWINLGHTQYNILPLIQISSITGVAGITFIICMVNEVIREIIAFNFSGILKSSSLKNKKEIFVYTVVTISVLLLTTGYGIFQLKTFNVSSSSPVNIAIIQPNIDQSIKWDKGHFKDTIDKYFRMTRTASDKHVDILLWPETAIPSLLLFDYNLMISIKNLLNEIKTYLVVGTVDIEPKSNLIFNTAMIFSPQGNMEGKYYKMHLVPFGEYLPWRKYLEKIPGLNEIVKPISRFTQGQEPVLFKTPYINFSTVICFESIFPDISRKCMIQGAQCIIVLTNDAWFERSAAPYQHNIISVFRAVENHTFVVRCANTGVSGVIDPLGRIIESTPIYEDRIIYGQIFPHCATTFYTFHGDLFALICFIISTLLLLHSFYKGKR
jgi:apolipoprotein N-acyltransferase